MLIGPRPTLAVYKVKPFRDINTSAESFSPL